MDNLELIWKRMKDKILIYLLMNCIKTAEQTRTDRFKTLYQSA